MFNFLFNQAIRSKLQAQNAVIQQQAQEIQQQAQEIQQQAQEIQQQAQIIDRIENSLSWKITTPMRSIRNHPDVVYCLKHLQKFITVKTDLK